MTRAIHALACQADAALRDLDDLERWILEVAPLIVDARQSTTHDRPLVTTSMRPSGMAEPEWDLRRAWRALTGDLGTAGYGLRRLGWPVRWSAPRDRGLPCDATLQLDGVLMTRPGLRWLHAELRRADGANTRLDDGQVRDAREVCRVVAAAARRCAMVTARPTVERERTCRRNACQDPATGMPRLMRPGERGKVCNACRKRDHRSRLAGAA